MKKFVSIAAIVAAFLCFSIVNADSDGGSGYTPVVKSADTVTGYIQAAVRKDGKLMLTVDYIDWYEGDDAKRIFREKEPDSGMDGPPDGYYIVNDSPETAEVELAPDAQVLMQIYDRDGNPADVQTVWNEPVTAAKFAVIYANKSLLDISEFPYHMTIQGGRVVKLVQQYVP